MPLAGSPPASVVSSPGPPSPEGVPVVGDVSDAAGEDSGVAGSRGSNAELAGAGLPSPDVGNASSFTLLELQLMAPIRHAAIDNVALPLPIPDAESMLLTYQDWVGAQ